MQRRLIPIALLGLAVGACSSPTAVTSTSPGPPSSSATTTVVVPRGEPAEVIKVFDGDSFEATVAGREVEVRILGINAPEGSECHGDVARDRLRDLLDADDVTLVADGEDSADRFDRLLRSVYAAGAFVNATMVAEGHAIALQSGDPQESTLVALSTAAHQAGLGMWAVDACGEATRPAIRIVDVEYDPPGRDFENKAEEWVTIRNDGDFAVDVGGWIIRDESSTHRYEFAAGETLAPRDELRIRTGCGDDGGLDRYWCANDAVWSNGGDTVIVQTAAGTVVDRLLYEGDF